MLTLKALIEIPYLITISFSFLLFVFVISLIKQQTIFKLMGLAFFIPFTSAFIILILSDKLELMDYFLLPELSLVLTLSLLLLIQPSKKVFKILQLSIYATPFLFLFLINNTTLFADIMKKGIYYIPMFILSLVVSITVLKREKGQHKLLILGLLTLVPICLTKPLSHIPFIVVIQCLLLLAVYIYLFLYFHHETCIAIMRKIVEAEKMMSDIDKTLNTEVRKRTFEIERSNQKLINMVKTDDLTKAYTKAAILSMMEDLIASRTVKEFSIIMFDIDRFKTINDTLGHIVGDKCIKKLASIAVNSLRDIDRLGRYGGDEFVIVLPGATTSESFIVAERFRKKIEETRDPQFTVSMGIASYPQDGFKVKDLISFADDGLYMSKEKGRNRVSHKTLL